MQLRLLVIILFSILLVSCILGPEEKAAVELYQKFDQYTEDKKQSLEEQGLYCFDNMLTDDGCHTWQFCDENACLPDPGRCVTDEDCPAEQTCQGYHRCM